MNKLFTLLVALPLFLNAQDKGDFELGIGGGLNLALFYGSDSEGYDARIGFQGGVTGEYYFSDQWGLKTGAIYDSKGGEGVTNNKLRFDYLFIPLYAGWHFGKDKNWYLNFGPHLDILLTAENEGNDFKDNIRSVDFGFGGGVGYRIEVSNNASIFVEYQGAGGLLEVFENGNNRFNTRSALNAGIVVML